MSCWWSGVPLGTQNEAKQITKWTCQKIRTFSWKPGGWRVACVVWQHDPWSIRSEWVGHFRACAECMTPLPHLFSISQFHILFWKTDSSGSLALSLFSAGRLCQLHMWSLYWCFPAEDIWTICLLYEPQASFWCELSSFTLIFSSLLIFISFNYNFKGYGSYKKYEVS